MPEEPEDQRSRSRSVPKGLTETEVAMFFCKLIESNADCRSDYLIQAEWTIKHMEDMEAIELLREKIEKYQPKK